VRKGPTSHLPLHYDDDNDDNDTTEIPPTEILGRIFIRTVGRLKVGAQKFRTWVRPPRKKHHKQVRKAPTKAPNG
jgi:hypothetical protein